MADEKSKIVTDATGPDAGPVPVQPEVGGDTSVPKQEQPAPEAVSPDKATAPEQSATAQLEKGADAPKEQKAASVSVFNFSEIMAEKKAAEKAATQQCLRDLSCILYGGRLDHTDLHAGSRHFLGHGAVDRCYLRL